LHIRDNTRIELLKAPEIEQVETPVDEVGKNGNMDEGGLSYTQIYIFRFDLTALQLDSN